MRQQEKENRDFENRLRKCETLEVQVVQESTYRNLLQRGLVTVDTSHSGSLRLRLIPDIVLINQGSNQQHVRLAPQ